MQPVHYGALGARHPGNDALDCTSCRVDLLEAFRAPADAPSPPVRSGITRTDADGDITRSDHITESGLRTPPGAAPSLYVTCSCGWSFEWALPPGFPEDTAKVMAQGRAFQHRADPGGTP